MPPKKFTLDMVSPTPAVESTTTPRTSRFLQASQSTQPQREVRDHHNDRDQTNHQAERPHHRTTNSFSSSSGNNLTSSFASGKIRLTFAKPAQSDVGVPPIMAKEETVVPPKPNVIPVVQRRFGNAIKPTVPVVAQPVQPVQPTQPVRRFVSKPAIPLVAQKIIEPIVIVQSEIDVDETDWELPPLEPIGRTNSTDSTTSTASNDSAVRNVVHPLQAQPTLNRRQFGNRQALTRTVIEENPSDNPHKKGTVQYDVHELGYLVKKQVKKILVDMNVIDLECYDYFRSIFEDGKVTLRLAKFESILIAMGEILKVIGSDFNKHPTDKKYLLMACADMFMYVMYCSDLEYENVCKMVFSRVDSFKTYYKDYYKAHAIVTQYDLSIDELRANEANQATMLESYRAEIHRIETKIATLQKTVEKTQEKIDIAKKKKKPVSAEDENMLEMTLNQEIPNCKEEEKELPIEGGGDQGRN